MSTIKFRIAAKTDVGLVRTNNEDNFQAASDLTSPQMRWVNNEICSLGEKGALLVVADGMGGMNAGEVASELAISTIKEYFTPENITPAVTANRYSIERFMNAAIVAADTNIKKTGKERPETRGMGTTIVIGWLLGGKLYVSWCGDSRAYVYNPAAGLHQITKDHSYVQDLVDKGSISPEDAFDFPDSNIITRSLSDGGGKAKPESLLKPYDVCDNDIILLCTDGLCGMIRDNEIEAVLRANEHNMDQCADMLIHAACEAEGADNITVCLCQILQGGGTCTSTMFNEYDARLEGPKPAAPVSPITKECDTSSDNHYKKRFFIAVGVIICLFCVIVAESYILIRKETNELPSATQESQPIVKSDTIQENTGVQENEFDENNLQKTNNNTDSASLRQDSSQTRGGDKGQGDNADIRDFKKGLDQIIISGKPDGLSKFKEDQLTPVDKQTNNKTSNKKQDSIKDRKKTNENTTVK